VGNVIYGKEVEILGFASQGLTEGTAGMVSQDLAVGEGEIGSAGHRRSVTAAFWRIDGSADQLSVWKLDAVAIDGGLEALDVFGANLMSKAS
jgi:hypothetical protein